MTAFSITRVRQLSVVSLPARVSVTNTRELLDAGLGEVTAGQRSVVLDLRTTEVLDSTALGAIVQLYRTAQARGASIVLLAPSDGVRRVLSITRLDGVLPIHGSLSEVVASASA
jgi:anti-sigma B factor antagonist